MARYATDDAGPLTFVAIRLLIAAALLGIFALVTRAPRPTRSQLMWSAIAGLGIHALYLGGVFLAISWGMPSGVSALIAGLNPVIISVFGRLVLDERLRRLQWLGVVLGFSGVLAVVIDHLRDNSEGITTGSLLAASTAVVGISAGTLLQRRRGGGTPLLWGTSTQYAASTVVLGVSALIHGGEGFTVTSRSIFAMLWAVGILSIAAVLIMLWLLKREAAAQVSSLFFLTPALSTLEGAILFGEGMGGLAIVGLCVALVGVSLTLREPR